MDVSIDIITFSQNSWSITYLYILNSFFLLTLLCFILFYLSNANKPIRFECTWILFKGSLPIAFKKSINSEDKLIISFFFCLRVICMYQVSGKAWTVTITNTVYMTYVAILYLSVHPPSVLRPPTILGEILWF